MKKLIITLSLLLNLGLTAMAQPGFEDDVNDVPLDGGISLLVGAGVAYGIKKVYQNKQQKHEQD